MAKQPKLMDFSKMRNMIEPHLEKIRRNLYLNNELGIVYGNPDIFRLAVQQEPPFLINDYRMGIIMRGELRADSFCIQRAGSRLPASDWRKGYTDDKEHYRRAVANHTSTGIPQTYGECAGGGSHAPLRRTVP